MKRRAGDALAARRALAQPRTAALDRRLAGGARRRFYYYEDPALPRLRRQPGAHGARLPPVRHRGAYAAGRAAQFGGAGVARGRCRSSRYDKVNLVPFGEFVPWPFGIRQQHLDRGRAISRPGKRVVVSPVGDHRIGTFICYESVFPQLRPPVRARRRGGAVQHLQRRLVRQERGARAASEIVRMRAAENRRWILRSTNDGITATIDPAGRLRGTLPLYSEAASCTGFNYDQRRRSTRATATGSAVGVPVADRGCGRAVRCRRSASARILPPSRAGSPERRRP